MKLMTEEPLILKRYKSKIRHCKERGVGFSLTLDEFTSLHSQSHCFYTGVKMTQREPGKPWHSTDATIDRVDASKSYETGNVVACCWSANKFKAYMEQPGELINLETGNLIIKKTMEFMNREAA